MAADLTLGSPEARAIMARAQTFLERLKKAEGRADEVAQLAKQAFAKVRAEYIETMLSELDIEQIKTVTEGRLRLEAISQAGYRSVRDLLDVSVMRLEQIRGV